MRKQRKDTVTKIAETAQKLNKPAQERVLVFCEGFIARGELRHEKRKRAV